MIGMHSFLNIENFTVKHPGFPPRERAWSTRTRESTRVTRDHAFNVQQSFSLGLDFAIVGNLGPTFITNS